MDCESTFVGDRQHRGAYFRSEQAFGRDFFAVQSDSFGTGFAVVAGFVGIEVLFRGAFARVEGSSDQRINLSPRPAAGVTSGGLSRRFGYAAERAQEDVADLRARALHSVSTADLIGDALPIALAHAISAYDACYVALVQRLSVPFVTADEALVRKLAGTIYDVQLLGSFANPPSW